MSKSRITRISIIALIIASMLGFSLRSALTARAADAKGKADKRPAEQVILELRNVGQQLSEVLESPQVLLDPQKRAEIAPKAIPPMKKLVALFEELGNAEQSAKAQATAAQRQLLAMLAVLGDAESIDMLEKRANGKESAQWKATLLLAKWWQANKDADAQSKILDDLEKLAKANSKDEQLAQIAAMFPEQAAANDELRDRAEKVVINDLKSPLAEQLAQGLQAAAKLRALTGKPLTLEGTTIDGAKFSTADWKGKVILVDFWATWCGPCREELPRVKKAYADFHKDGLEILGVSCDKKGEILKQFLVANPDMPWPQLFDPNAKGGWHPLADSYGISGIPTMFLIDKKGLVRTVTARENYEELIPKMLKEEL
jgi:thiol-disulfide isomerase/thioredoxin